MRGVGGLALVRHLQNTLLKGNQVNIPESECGYGETPFFGKSLFSFAGGQGSVVTQMNSETLTGIPERVIFSF